MADKPNLVIGYRPDGRSVANSRFTRTPITFDRLFSGGDSEGRYYDRARGDPSIHVDVPNAPDLANLQNAIHHEDIHALLDAAGAKDKPLDQQLLRIPSKTQGGLEQFLPENWGMSKRAGSMANELPSYLGAYSEGTIKGITPESAASWITRYAAGLPEGTRNTLSRIQSSNDASQRGTPTGSTYTDPAKFRYKGAREK